MRKFELNTQDSESGYAIKILSVCLLTLLILSGLTACQSTGLQVDTIEEMDKTLAEGAYPDLDDTNKIKSKQQGAVKPLSEEQIRKEVKAELQKEQALQLTALNKKNASERFDISVSDVPADQFYMSLVDGTSFNIVVHPELKGDISLNLKNVSIMDVMKAVRDVYGYEFERTRYGLRVLPNQLESRIFHVNYLNVERSGISSTSVSSGTLQSNGDSGNPGVEDGSGSRSGSGSSSSGSTGTQVTTLQPVTSFWFEVDQSIQSIIGNGEGRSVVISPQSGLVVVKAIPNELREVEKYLSAVQNNSQRQVIMEAKILEVELNDSFRSGVNWSAFTGDFTVGHTGGGPSLESDQGFSDARGFIPPAGLALGEVIPASSFGGVFSLAIHGSKFGAFIELLESQGSVQVLSSPRISTMNNQKAVIKVGQDEFFVTEVSSDSSTGAASTNTTADIELTPFFSGIALDVTPQISDKNYVTLHIHPSVSRVREQQKILQVNGQTQSLPLARSTIRESDSIIRARSGQIVVIGGLMQDSTDDRDVQTPGASKLPLVGNLFKQKGRSKAKSELIILLRPIVVEGPEQWAGAVTESRDYVGEIRDQLDDWNLQ